MTSNGIAKDSCKGRTSNLTASPTNTRGKILKSLSLHVASGGPVKVISVYQVLSFVFSMIFVVVFYPFSRCCGSLDSITARSLLVVFILILLFGGIQVSVFSLFLHGGVVVYVV